MNPHAKTVFTVTDDIALSNPGMLGRKAMVVRGTENETRCAFLLFNRFNHAKRQAKDLRKNKRRAANKVARLARNLNRQ